ncbi:hypothetical protein R1flu_003738 [Riccia fluitans]|uniref:DUF1499 domain-containing protein n=1 Tax=Riccia fluitans TaxID=41844 RepID=A0ABD1Y9U7_9MARC
MALLHPGSCLFHRPRRKVYLSSPKRSSYVKVNALSTLRIVCGLAEEEPGKVAQDLVNGGLPSSTQVSRREIILRTSSLAMLAFINFRGERPDYLGVQKSVPSLALCPATPNCISTAEEINDPGHYVPPWTYNPEEGRGKRNPVSKEQAMQELIEVVEKTKPDNFTPRIVKKTDDYLYVEYESPLFKFIDDVEFWFPPGNRSIVEYRSASRVGNQDFNINRKRIKALRQALEKKGWRSVGF